MPTRLGIFGGSFDPVHYGHLLLAESCREQCQLDQVWMLPAFRPPHKQTRDLASDQHRVEMLRLAIGGHRALVVSTLEIDRGGVSYTVDTLAAVHQDHSDSELFLLMGADTLHDLPNWHQPREICQLAIPVAVGRRGWPEPDDDLLRQLVPNSRWEQIRNYQVTMPLIEVTSTEIRQRVSRGQSIRYRTPRAVEKYIESNHLYGEAD
jgi:nicotinate-nucleotide adenylyltransferase